MFGVYARVNYSVEHLHFSQHQWPFSTFTSTRIHCIHAIPSLKLCRFSWKHIFNGHALKLLITNIGCTVVVITIPVGDGETHCMYIPVAAKCMLSDRRRGRNSHENLYASTFSTSSSLGYGCVRVCVCVSMFRCVYVCECLRRLCGHRMRKITLATARR